MSGEEKVSQAGEKGSIHTPSESSAVLYSAADEKRLLRKLDANLLPAVIILYLLSFLDRSNGASYRFLPLNDVLHVNAHGMRALQWRTHGSRG